MVNLWSHCLVPFQICPAANTFNLTSQLNVNFFHELDNMLGVEFEYVQGSGSQTIL